MQCFHAEVMFNEAALHLRTFCYAPPPQPPSAYPGHFRCCSSLVEGSLFVDARLPVCRGDAMQLCYATFTVCVHAVRYHSTLCCATICCML